MSAFAYLLLCIQACLIQNAFGYCIGAGPFAAYEIAAPCGMRAEFSGPYGIGAPVAVPKATKIVATNETKIVEPSGFKGLEYRVAAPCGTKYGAAGMAGYGAAGLAGYGAAGLAGYGAAGLTGYGAGCGQAYGGSGIGNVAVAGELPVGGSTAVAGQVPIIGTVEYTGPVAAAGAVTIAGNCAGGCGCGGYRYGMY